MSAESRQVPWALAQRASRRSHALWHRSDAHDPAVCGSDLDAMNQIVHKGSFLGASIEKGPPPVAVPPWLMQDVLHASELLLTRDRIQNLRPIPRRHSEVRLVR